MKLANLTLRRQTDSAQAFFRARGYEVEVQPRGLILGSEQPPYAVEAAARRAVDAAVERGCGGLLLGGAVESGVYLARAAHERGLPCFGLLIKRRREVDGTFTYELTDIREIAPPDEGAARLAWECGGLRVAAGEEVPDGTDRSTTPG